MFPKGILLPQQTLPSVTSLCGEALQVGLLMFAEPGRCPEEQNVGGMCVREPAVYPQGRDILDV